MSSSTSSGLVLNELHREDVLPVHETGAAGTRPPSERLPKLDFLRALSAGIVIAYHYGFEAIPAGFGVLTFFVISGFLITFLLLKESGRTGTISLRRFYLRRALRLFPAFYVYWLIAVGALLAFKPKSLLWGQVICSFFYVGNYYQGLHGYPSTLLSHTWSLGVEEQFYLLWPGVVFLLRDRLGALMRGLVVAIPTLWVYRAAIDKLGVSDAYIYTSLETRIDAILVGCLLAVVLYTGTAARLIAELRKARYTPLVLILLAASLFGGATLVHDYKNLIGFAVDPVLLALLILQLTSLHGLKWMDSKPIAYLGKISYSTYLYQQILLPLVRPHLFRPIALAGCFLVIWAVSALSYEVVEKPYARLKERFETVKVAQP